MSTSFNEAYRDSAGFILRPGCKTEHRGYFNDCRIDRNTVPEGWYVYDFRTTDSGNLCTIEEWVTVNHGGTFITKTPLKFPVRRNADGNIIDDKYICLAGRGGYTFDYSERI